MSTFACEVVKLRLTPHPNADQIEIANIGGYQAIVRKGIFADGQLAVYVPEQAIVPEQMLKSIGLWDEAKQKGALAGSAGNRVKAIKLRGVLSQGLVVHVPGDVLLYPEGYDAAEDLGITKWEPAIPANMAGRLAGADYDVTLTFDFENIKKRPDLFEVGERVSITEKLHGTFAIFGVVPAEYVIDRAWTAKQEPIVVGSRSFYGVISSKGQSAKGFLLDLNDDTNLYVRAGKPLLQRLAEWSVERIGGTPVYILGEIFGDVQDLKYGHAPGAVTFAAFDLYIGTRSLGEYDSDRMLVDAALSIGAGVVPELYRGPYHAEILKALTDGPTTLATGQIREGVVVRSLDGRRKIAKSVSEAYLLRKNATEIQ